MQLQAIDWVVVAVYGLASLLTGIVFTKRAGRSLEQYFLSGRKLPCWLLGTSMVATTFSTDTPNLVTDMVRNGGESELTVVGLSHHRHADRVLLRQALAAVRRFDRHQLLRVALFRPPCRLLARLPRHLSRRLLQHNDHGDGNPRRHQDRGRLAWPRPLT
jgi:hypothetical protein